MTLEEWKENLKILESDTSWVETVIGLILFDWEADQDKLVTELGWLETKNNNQVITIQEQRKFINDIEDYNDRLKNKIMELQGVKTYNETI